jgi:type I restriction enzyme S subunit
MVPNQCHDRFAMYVYSAEHVRQYLDSMVQSATRSHQRANPDDITKMKAAWPPLPEQRAIAAYLDRETERIDALLDKKQRLIDLLEEKRTALISHAVTKGLDDDAEMQDSGVEWLGAIPAGWRVIKLKYLADVQGGIAKGKKYGDDQETTTLPYLRVANVQDGYLDLDDISEIEVALTEVGRYALRPGDVLMNEGGDYDKLGRGAVWNGEIQPCLHQNHVFAVRPKEVESEWLAQVTQTRYAKHFFILRSVQSTNLASISMTSLQDLPVVVPPQEERKQILTTLAQSADRLNALVSKVRDGIARLKEYRTALISAAVTGRIDVRGSA